MKKQTYCLPQIRSAHRLQEAPPAERTINSPEAVRRLWKRSVAAAPWFDLMKENVVVFALNAKFQPQGWNIVSIGSLNESLTNPREIFRPLISVAAYAFILAHNHPSGNPKPSKKDVRFTKRVAACGKLLGIELIDHVVIGAGKEVRSVDRGCARLALSEGKSR